MPPHLTPSSPGSQRGFPRGLFPTPVDPHQQIYAQLGQLAELASAIRGGAALDQAVQVSARQAHIFFTTVALNHHIDEERAVFAPMMDRGDLRAKIIGLRQDHNLLKSLWLKIAPDLDALARGYRWRDMAAFRNGVETFVQLYRAHIAAEDQFLSNGDMHEST